MIQDDNSWQLNRHCLGLALVMILMASSVSAWAGKVQIFVQSSPSTGGYVYANSKDENNISTLTSDDATSSYQVGGSVTMYRYAKEKEGYEFRGWADTDGGTPTSKSANVSLDANMERVLGSTTFGLSLVDFPNFISKQLLLRIIRLMEMRM